MVVACKDNYSSGNIMLEECLSNSGPGSETEDFLLRAYSMKLCFSGAATYGFSYSVLCPSFGF